MSDKNIKETIKSLEPWFHNILLPNGELTAPDHPLGDFPSYKWEVIAPVLPDDMSGLSVLDIGCNAGFYSLQCAKRGAAVTAIDIDNHYLKQAKWISEIFNVSKNIKFHRLQVYDLVKKDWHFDIVLFLGVFYHLRYPLLAIDIIAEKVKQLLVFQSLLLHEDDEYIQDDNFSFNKREIMLQKGWPSMAFIENKFMDDPTNWWVPNAPAVKAMFRTAGFEFLNSPGQEVFILKPNSRFTAVAKEWNRSELLSASGRSWLNTAQLKTGNSGKQ